MIVGFIGLGTMGRNACRNVMRAGFQVIVHDIRPEAMTPLVERGAAAAQTPAEVISRADAVVTMVFGPREI